MTGARLLCGNDLLMNMSNCPNCTVALTDLQIKTIWSAYTTSRIKHRSGGPKITCDCGTCSKCKQRFYRRKARAELMEKT